MYFKYIKYCVAGLNNYHLVQNYYHLLCILQSALKIDKVREYKFNVPCSKEVSTGLLIESSGRNNVCVHVVCRHNNSAGCEIDEEIKLTENNIITTQYQLTDAAVTKYKL